MTRFIYHNLKRFQNFSVIMLAVDIADSLYHLLTLSALIEFIFLLKQLLKLFKFLFNTCD